MITHGTLSYHTFAKKVDEGAGISPSTKCLGSFFHFAAIIAVIAVTILNLTGSLDASITGLAFLGGSIIRIAWQSYRIYKASSAATKSTPWAKMLLRVTLTAIPVLLGGILGLSKAIPADTMGWFFMGALLVEATLACTLSKKETQVKKSNVPSLEKIINDGVEGVKNSATLSKLPQHADFLKWEAKARDILQRKSLLYFFWHSLMDFPNKPDPENLLNELRQESFKPSVTNFRAKYPEFDALFTAYTACVPAPKQKTSVDVSKSHDSSVKIEELS